MAMELNFRIAGRIARPVEEVYEAIADPEKLARFFATGGAKGRIETGNTLYWKFKGFTEETPVKVIEAVPNEMIILEWQAYEGETGKIGAKIVGVEYATTVTFLFKALDDGRTLVQIIEEGWNETPGGLRGSYNNCEGWTSMLLTLKGMLEHDINLGDGLYH